MSSSEIMSKEVTSSGYEDRQTDTLISRKKGHPADAALKPTGEVTEGKIEETNGVEKSEIPKGSTDNTTPQKFMTVNEFEAARVKAQEFRFVRQTETNLSPKTIWQFISLFLLFIFINFLIYHFTGDGSFSDLSFVRSHQDILQQKMRERFQYVVVVDAGSTGSRVHVYEFNSTLDFDRSTLPIPKLVNEIFELTRPGLSHGEYIQNFELGARSLNPLLKSALKVVPPKAYKSTPLVVKATAGLRLIGNETSTAYLDYIKNYISNRYPFDVRSVEIMDGKEEAVYAWLTTNYLLGNLEDEDHVSESEITESAEGIRLRKNRDKKHTAAVFDLGGASTQIVFQPHSHVYTDEVMDKIVSSGHGDHVYDLELGSNKYRLYQNSHLGYGLMEMRKKVHSVVLEKFLENVAKTGDVKLFEKTLMDKKQITRLENPCISTDMERSVKVPIREILECVLADEKLVPLARIDRYISRLTKLGLIENDGQTELMTLRMRGPKEPLPVTHCLNIATEILNLDAECKFHPCSFNGVHQPSLTESFGAKNKQARKLRNSFEDVFQEEQENQAIKDKEHQDHIDHIDHEIEGNLDQGDEEEAPLYIFSYFYDRTFPLGLPSTFPLSHFRSLLSSVCLGPRAWDPDHPNYSSKFEDLSSEVVDELDGRPEWCLDLGVMYAMLNKGYGIPDERQMTVAKKIDGYELGWCLGAAIGLLGDLEEEKETKLVQPVETMSKETAYENLKATEGRSNYETQEVETAIRDEF